MDDQLAVEKEPEAKEPVVKKVAKMTIKKPAAKKEPAAKVEAKEEPVAKKASNDKAGLVTLGDLAKKNKWSAREARVHLRKAKMKKPASGSWAWPSSEASKVEKKLKEFFTGTKT